MLRRVFTQSLALLVLGMTTSSVLGQVPRKPSAKSPQARLTKKVSVDLKDVSLEDALARLRELSKDSKIKDDPGLKLYVDPVALSEAKVTLQTKVNLVLSDVPLGTALKLLVRPLNLAYTVRGDLVVVTSRRR